MNILILPFLSNWAHFLRSWLRQREKSNPFELPSSFLTSIISQPPAPLIPSLALERASRRCRRPSAGRRDLSDLVPLTPTPLPCPKRSFAGLLPTPIRTRSNPTTEQGPPTLKHHYHHSPRLVSGSTANRPQQRRERQQQQQLANGRRVRFPRLARAKTMNRIQTLVATTNPRRG
jgi:hypothetical protein